MVQWWGGKTVKVFSPAKRSQLELSLKLSSAIRLGAKFGLENVNCPSKLVPSLLLSAGDNKVGRGNWNNSPLLTSWLILRLLSEGKDEMTPLLENWLEINYNWGMPGTDTVVLSYKINKPKPRNIKVFMKNISRSLATSTWSLRMWARRTTGRTSARSTPTLPSTRWGSCSS